MWPGYPSSRHIHSHYWAVMCTQTTLTQATAWHARCSRYGTSVRTLLRKGAPTKPLNAFIIRPFGTKDVLLPGKEAVVDGAKVRVSKLMKVNFDEVHQELIGPALGRLHIAANTTEAVIEAGNIREDMFHLLMTADRVVADMTLHNPNVFYELGIRHAFRDKYTFLIRSEGHDDPFDLKTDRYFHYNHERPGESVEKLYKAIRATLASERTDSPVFRLLPKMRAEDRSRFIAVPRDFLEDVERAKKHR